MDKVFMVRGHAGEYSDYSTWPVVVMNDVAQANEHAKMCQEISDELYSDAGWPEDRYACIEGPHRLDPNFRADYTGTTYDVVAVPWKEG